MMKKLAAVFWLTAIIAVSEYVQGQTPVRDQETQKRPFYAFSPSDLPPLETARWLIEARLVGQRSVSMGVATPVRRRQPPRRRPIAAGAGSRRPRND